jgi:hypothetical protein
MNQLIMQGMEGKLQTERSRIVGLCVTLTGNIDVAEDLAQALLGIGTIVTTARTCACLCAKRIDGRAN